MVASEEGFPTIHVSTEERAAGTPTRDTVDRACGLFERSGAVRLVGVFTPAFTQRLADHLERRYWMRLQDTDDKGRHPRFSPRLAGPFAEADYLTPPLLFPVVQRLLGEDCVLGAFGAMVSLPRAPDRPGDRGAESLYEDYTIDVQLPPFALTVVFALVDTDADTGSTSVWPGTHRVSCLEQSRAMPSVAPLLHAGAALMIDSRTLRGSAANASRRVQPFVYNSYHRSWYRQAIGDERLPPVNIGPLALMRSAPARRAMLRIPSESSAYERASWNIKRASSRLKRVDALRRLKRTLVRRSAT